MALWHCMFNLIHELFLSYQAEDGQVCLADGE